MAWVGRCQRENTGIFSLCRQKKADHPKGKNAQNWKRFISNFPY
jgi:hypothetical protein